ncbi:MAG: Ig-like domain-containing protein [Solobacterium sp.]|nr:Ig-like domain-containing protein [Solobacterium sp.]
MDDTNAGEEITWSYANRVLTLSGSGEMYDYSINDAAPWIEYKDEIQTVIIGEGITSIGNYAFWEHSALTKVTLPSTLTRVGDYAFYDDFKNWNKTYTTLTLPSGLEYIGDYAFYGASLLPFKSATLPAGLWYIGEGAFNDCDGMKGTLVIPEGITEINAYAFYGMNGITAIEFPSEVTSIGEEAFASLTAVQEIRIPDSVERVERYAFAWGGYKTLIIGKNVEYLGHQSCDTSSLTKVIFLGDVPRVDDYGGYTFSNVNALAYYPEDNWTWTESAKDTLAQEFKSVIWIGDQLFVNVTYVIGEDDEYTEQEAKNMLLAEPHIEGEFGYHIVGWYTSPTVQNSTTQWNFRNNILRNDLTLYAKWDQIHVNGIRTSRTSLIIRDDEEIDLYEYVHIVPIDALNQNIIWTSSNPESVSVNEDGVISCVNPGTSTITATTEEGHYSVSINITATVGVKDVSFVTDYTDIAIGYTDQLSFEITPPNASNKNVAWESDDESIAVVDENGVVTGISEGTTYITVITEDGGYTASCIINVYTVYSESLEITADTFSVIYVETMQLKATVYPTNTTNQNVIWSSSDDSIVSVDENGIITGTGNGTAVITATAEDTGVSTSIEILGIVPVSGVSLNSDKLDIVKENTDTLTPVFEPENATNKNVTWSSSDEGIVIVDENGVVTAVEGGTATITATTEDGGYTAQCEVTVIVLAEGIEITSDISEIKYGETAQLTAQISPANTTNQNVTWASIDESVLTVDENGVVTPVWEGTAAIIATSEDGGFTASREITVLFTHAGHVEFAESETTITAGQDKQLSLVFDPADASEKGALYEVVEGTGYLSVDPNTGLIAGLQCDTTSDWKPGKAVVRATTIDGSLTAECTVYVYPDGIYIKDIGDYDYTGAQIKPVPEVYDGDRLLTLNTDYTLGYKNNTNAGTATVTIRMKGNYTGNQDVNFTIKPIDLTGNELVTYDPLSMEYTGKVLKPNPAVYYNGKRLGNNSNYTIDYTGAGWNQIDAGIQTILIHGKGNYTGTVEVIVKISRKEDQVLMSKLGVKTVNVPYFSGMTFDDVVINGLTVTDNQLKTTLAYGTDYIVENKPAMTGAGNYTFWITGTNDRYIGDRKVTVKVTGISITDGKVKIAIPADRYVYTGDAITLTEAELASYMTYNGEAFRAEDLEIVSITNNINTGNAKITIRGLNGFTGTRNINFRINPKKDVVPSDLLEESYWYVNGGVKPAFVISDGHRELIAGKDYNIQYQNNNRAGTATLKITFKGNYNGSQMYTEPYTIKVREPEICIAVSAPYMKNGARPEMVLREGDRVLVEGKDYTLKYQNNNKVGTAKITVTFKGDYNGVAAYTQEYEVTKQDLALMSITAKDVTWANRDGNYKSNPVVKDLNDKNLGSGSDYDKNWVYEVHNADNTWTVLGPKERVAVGSEIRVTVHAREEAANCYYTGSVSYIYRVTAKDINRGSFTIRNQEYTGSEVTLTEADFTKAMESNMNLVYGTDYEIVRYENNIKVGTAKVIIRGLGNYGGEKTLTFRIGQRSIINHWKGLLKKLGG